MSTIAVVKKNNHVAIAADSLASYGSVGLQAEYDSNPDKIFRVADSYVGAVGYAADSMVLESALSKLASEELEFKATKDIFETFRKLHPVLKKDYYLVTEEEGEQPYESSHLDVLIANPFGIFGVLSYREVFQYERFWATGTGWKFALGAMCASYDDLSTAEDIVRCGLRAACEFDQGSDEPCLVHSFPLAGCQ